MKTNDTTDTLAPGLSRESQGSESTRADLEHVVQSLPVDHVGTTVHLKGWRLGEAPLASILFVHDVGEQSDHYQQVAERLVADGYGVYAFDLRGHGRSGRRLGHIPSFAALVRDLLQVAAWVRHHDGQPPVIIGHGVGALVVMEFTKLHSAYCRAAVLSAPCLEFLTPLAPWRLWLLKLISETAPRLRLPVALCPKFSGRERGGNTATASHHGADGSRPILFPGLSARFTQALLKAMKQSQACEIAYEGKVLILCPERDALIGYQKVKKAVALHKAHNLALVDLPLSSHAVFCGNASERLTALDALLPWLERTLRESSGDPNDQSDRAKDERRRGGSVRADKPGATKS